MLLDSTRSTSEIELNPSYHSATYQYFYNPIAYDQGDAGRGLLVSSIQSINLTTEYDLTKSASLGIELPLHQLNYYQQGTKFAFGDARVFSKIKLYDEPSSHHLKIAMVPSLYAPTGNSDLMLSNSNGGVGTNLVLESDIANFTSTHGALNIGLDYFPRASYSNVNYELQGYAGLGIKHDFSSTWSTQVEWMGRQIRSIRTGDLYGGGQYNLSSDRTIFLGASLASTQLDGTNLEYRLMAGVRWAPAYTKVITRQIHTKIETVQKIKKILDCGPKLFSKKFPGRPLTEAEKLYIAKKQLTPYISTPARHFDTLRLGGKNGITPSGIPFVKDAQVLFAVDLIGLPARNTVITLKVLDLSVKINKIWTPEKIKTDMICFLEEKICSGDLYNVPPMIKNINSSFFSGKEPPNDFFTRQIAETIPATGAPPQISSAHLTIPLARLLENSILSDPLELIYSKQGSKTLYFGVAHDIYLSNTVQLSVELSAQSCEETNPAPTTETHESEPQIEESEIHNE